MISKLLLQPLFLFPDSEMMDPPLIFRHVRSFFLNTNSIQFHQQPLPPPLPYNHNHSVPFSSSLSPPPLTIPAIVAVIQ